MTGGRLTRGKVGVGAAVALIAALVGLTGWLLRDPLPHFQRRRSALAAVEERWPTMLEGSRLQTVRLVASSGLAVTLTTRRQSSDSARRLPLVVILGGHVTGSEAATLIGPAPGILLAALSYPFEGDPRPSKLTFLRQIPSIRRAFLDTPPAVSIALDYLLTLPEVDTTRVEGIGVSLGVPFMTIAGALDPRITRVWALHGSGGSYAPLEASMKPGIPVAPLRALAAEMANVIISGPNLAPERWAPRIAPRPFIMINASDDERLPRSAVLALYRSARAPKELIWMSGGHIHGDQPTIQRLVRLVLERVSAVPAASDARRAATGRF